MENYVCPKCHGNKYLNQNIKDNIKYICNRCNGIGSVSWLDNIFDNTDYSVLKLMFTIEPPVSIKK
jgi:hypothetical protein